MLITSGTEAKRQVKLSPRAMLNYPYDSCFGGGKLYCLPISGRGFAVSSEIGSVLRVEIMESKVYSDQIIIE